MGSPTSFGQSWGWVNEGQLGLGKGGAARAGEGHLETKLSTGRRWGHWWEPCARGLAGGWQVWLSLEETAVVTGLPGHRVEPGRVRPGRGAQGEERWGCEEPVHRAQATGLLSLRRNDPGSWWLVSLTRGGLF